MDLIREVENKYKKEEVPSFSAGDRVKVFVKVVEGGRERTQGFEGNVIRRRGGGTRETFTVRRVSYGIGIERTFPIHSPIIDRIEVINRGVVRQSRLYFLRNLVGKKTRIKVRRNKSNQTKK